MPSSFGGKRHINPVVDGQLVPRARKAAGHGQKIPYKRRRDDSAAPTSSTRARRPRRAVDCAAMNDPGLEDEDDGSD